MKRKSLLILLPFIVSVNSFGMTLKQVVKKTLNLNPSVLAHKQEMLAAKYGVNAAVGDFLPTVDLSAGYGTEKSKNSSTSFNFVTLHPEEYSATVNENVFSGFESINGINRSRYAYKASEYQLNAAKNDMALKAIKAYCDVLRYKEIVYAAKQDYLKHQELFNKIQKKSQAGAGRGSDVYQAKGRLSLAKANLLAAENDLLNAKEIFQQITGEMPAALTAPKRISAAKLPKSKKQAAQMALAKNPLILGANANVKSENYRHQAAKGNFLPRVDLTLSLNHDRDVGGIVGPNYSYEAGVNASYNVFNGGKDYANVKKNAAFLEQAKEQRLNIMRELKQNAESAWNNYTITKLQLSFYATHLTNAQKTSASFYKQFNIDQRTLVDLLNAENEQFAASKNYINAKYDLILEQYELLNSTGKLIEYFN